MQSAGIPGASVDHFAFACAAGYLIEFDFGDVFDLFFHCSYSFLINMHTRFFLHGFIPLYLCVAMKRDLLTERRPASLERVRGILGGLIR